MAIRKLADRGSRNSTSTGNATITITDPTAIKLGSYLIMRVGVDNSGSSGALPGLAVSDSRSHTWTVGTGALQDPGAASAGIAAYLCYIRVNTLFLAGDTITLTWTTGSPRCAVVVEEWAGIDWITPAAVAQTTANNVSTTAQPAISRTPTASGQLMYAMLAIEGNTGDFGAQDSDTTDGSWVALSTDTANTGTHDTSVSIYGGYKIVTGTTAQTWNNTLGVTGDWAAVALVFGAGAQAQIWTLSGATQVEDPPEGAWEKGPERVQAIVSVSANVNPSSVAAAGGVGTPTIKISITPASVAAVAAAPAPGIQASATLTPSSVSAAAAISAPGLSTALSPSGVGGAAAIGAPAISATASVAPASVAAIAAAPAPQIQASADVSPAPVAASAAISAPAISATAQIAPAAVAAIAGVGAPAITAGTSVAPASVAAAAAISAPAISASADVAPGSVAAIAAAGAPAISATAVVSPASVAAIAGVGSPAVLAGTTIFPAAVAALADAAAPAISATATIAPSSAAAAAGVGAPGIQGSAEVAPSSVSALAGVGLPAVDTSSDIAIHPPAVAAAAAIDAPAISASAQIFASAVQALARIFAPFIRAPISPADYRRRRMRRLAYKIEREAALRGNASVSRSLESGWEPLLPWDERGRPRIGIEEGPFVDERQAARIAFKAAREAALAPSPAAAAALEAGWKALLPEDDAGVPLIWDSSSGWAPVEEGDE